MRRGLERRRHAVGLKEKVNRMVAPRITSRVILMGLEHPYRRQGILRYVSVSLYGRSRDSRARPNSDVDLKRLASPSSVTRSDGPKARLASRWWYLSHIIWKISHHSSSMSFIWNLFHLAFFLPFRRCCRFRAVFGDSSADCLGHATLSADATTADPRWSLSS